MDPQNGHQDSKENAAEIDPNILEQSSDISLVVGPAFTGIPAEIKSNAKFTQIEKERGPDPPRVSVEFNTTRPDSPINSLGNGRFKQNNSSKSVNYDETVYDCKQEELEAEQARKQKEKSYTEKKDHKFATVKHHGLADQDKWNSGMLNPGINVIHEVNSQANMPTPINLFTDERCRDEVSRQNLENAPVCPLVIKFDSDSVK